MTDDAAVAWAKTYARPLKQLFGGLKLPPEVTAMWLPEADYKSVAQLKSIPDVGTVAEEWESNVH